LVKLSTIKEVLDALQSLATIAAIIGGGIWFLSRRQRYPRADVTHNITHKVLPDGKLLLHVAVRISNKGEVLLTLISGITRVQQMLPLSSSVVESINEGLDPVKKGQTEIEWPPLYSRESEWKEGKLEIEPGESDHINHDFILEAGVQTVEVYTYFKNAMKSGKEIGWQLTTVYDLNIAP
jgi:hypothetical protein